MTAFQDFDDEDREPVDAPEPDSVVEEVAPPADDSVEDAQVDDPAPKPAAEVTIRALKTAKVSVAGAELEVEEGAEYAVAPDVGRLLAETRYIEEVK